MFSTKRMRDLLDFERDWAAHEGGKAKAIKARFRFSPARYYQLLGEAIEMPAAMEYDPLTVRRLRRRRSERQAQQATAHPSTLRRR